MIPRRSFLGALSIGLGSSWINPASTFGQASPPKKGDGAAAPPPQPDERISRVLEATRGGNRRIPGMVGAIVKGSTITGIAAIGIRKIGSEQKFQWDDAVHLGSCTKAMTATMIGTLVEQRKLRWDSTFRDVFPSLAPSFHPDYQAVTLKQLMAHRAGLPRNVSWGDLGPSRSPTEQRRTMMSRVLRDPPRSQPGSKYDYSNVGFALAGLMAEEVTKTPWEPLMKRRLFEPLGMKAAGFGPAGTKGKVDQPWGHVASGDSIEPRQIDNPSSLGPAGTVHCSIPDWARFASVHMKGGLDQVHLLEPETLKVLHTPELGQEYVGGWLVNEDSRVGGPVLSHRGSNTSWFSAIWLAPSLNLAILVATNSGSDAAESACDEAVQGLVALETFDNRRKGRRR